MGREWRRRRRRGRERIIRAAGIQAGLRCVVDAEGKFVGAGVCGSCFFIDIKRERRNSDGVESVGEGVFHFWTEDALQKRRENSRDVLLWKDRGRRRRGEVRRNRGGGGTRWRFRRRNGVKRGWRIRRRWRKMRNKVSVGMKGTAFHTLRVRNKTLVKLCA